MAFFLKSFFQAVLRTEETFPGQRIPCPGKKAGAEGKKGRDKPSHFLPL
jgi:hypothetical protein